MCHTDAALTALVISWPCYRGLPPVSGPSPSDLVAVSQRAVHGGCVTGAGDIAGPEQICPDCQGDVGWTVLA